jgi:transcriptional antiterminator RfaH
LHWYLVHTKPRQERIALLNLQRQGFTCYMPTLPQEKLRQGALSVSEDPLFPRYLFIQLGTGISAQSWAPIRSTTGVNRLVSFGTQPAKVDDELIAALQAEEKLNLGQTQRLYNPGEHVRLTEGAFAGVEGIYQVADGESRAMILIELMSKPVRMRVPLAGLRKIA